MGYRLATRPAMSMEGQGYRVNAGDRPGWSASAAVGPPITLHKGGNGGSKGFEKVEPLVHVVGGEAGQRRGDHLPRAFGAPVPLVGDVKSSPAARGRMARLERKKQGAESTAGAPIDMPGGESNPKPATQLCDGLPLGHTASGLCGGPRV